MTAFGLCGDSVPDRPDRRPPCRAPASRAFLLVGRLRRLGVRVELRCPSCLAPSRRWWARIPLDEALVLLAMQS